MLLPEARENCDDEITPEERAELVQILTGALDNADSVTRRNAALSLGNVDLPADSLARLIGTLADQDLLVRFAARSALDMQGTRITPALIQGLKNDNPDVRLGLIEVLSIITNNPPPSGSDSSYRAYARSCRRALLEALSDRDPRVREAVALGLALDVEPPLGELLQILRKEDDPRWRGARETLVLHGTISVELRPIIDALADDSSAFRNELIDILVEIAKAEPEQLRMLRNVERSDPRIRQALIILLKRLE
jgi:hypothetical protein